MIGCTCSTCRSKDPRDKRLRSSLLLEKDGKRIIIDTGPEFRLQALRVGLDSLDAILYTHAHADHLNGIDDIRPLSRYHVLPLYGNETTIAQIRYRFSYAVDNAEKYGALPHLQTHVLRPYEICNICGFPVQPVVLFHGNIEDFGYRIGKMAYLTDCSRIPPETYPYLHDLDLLVLDALQHHDHPTHFNIFQAIEEARKIGARQTLFTHISHGLMHGRDSVLLPRNMAFAYDMLSLELSEEDGEHE